MLLSHQGSPYSVTIALSLGFSHCYSDMIGISSECVSKKLGKVKVSQSCPTLWDPMDFTVHGIAGRFFTSWATKEAQEYWSGQACPFSRIFPTQGLNPSVPHSWRILYQLSHKRSPRILKWAACPFSSGLSRPRNWTGFSCIAARPTELCGKPIPQVNSCFALCRVSVRTVLNFNR